MFGIFQHCQMDSLERRPLARMSANTKTLITAFDVEADRVECPLTCSVSIPTKQESNQRPLNLLHLFVA